MFDGNCGVWERAVASLPSSASQRSPPSTPRVGRHSTTLPSPKSCLILNLRSTTKVLLDNLLSTPLKFWLPRLQKLICGSCTQNKCGRWLILVHVFNTTPTNLVLTTQTMDNINVASELHVPHTPAPDYWEYSVYILMYNVLHCTIAWLLLVSRSDSFSSLGKVQWNTDCHSCYQSYRCTAPFLLVLQTKKVSDPLFSSKATILRPLMTAHVD